MPRNLTRDRYDSNVLGTGQIKFNKGTRLLCSKSCVESQINRLPQTGRALAYAELMCSVEGIRANIPESF